MLLQPRYSDSSVCHSRSVRRVEITSTIYSRDYIYLRDYIYSQDYIYSRDYTYSRDYIYSQDCIYSRDYIYSRSVRLRLVCLLLSMISYYMILYYPQQNFTSDPYAKHME